MNARYDIALAPPGALPVVALTPEFDSPNCDRECLFVRSVFTGMAEPKPVPFYGIDTPVDGQWIMADLDLRRYADFDAYLTAAKRAYKGNAIRDARKAAVAGATVRRFHPRNHSIDMHAIIHSMPVRSGGEMPGYLMMSLESLGGIPTELRDIEPETCPLHYQHYWGLFLPEPGHRQGDLAVDERLIAYAVLMRAGNSTTYRTIYGHGDYLRLGAVYHMHLRLMEHLLARTGPATQGIDHFSYAGMFQGGDGRTLWKKKMLFEPALYTVRHDLLAG